MAAFGAQQRTHREGGEQARQESTNISGADRGELPRENSKKEPSEVAVQYLFSPPYLAMEFLPGSTAQSPARCGHMLPSDQWDRAEGTLQFQRSASEGELHIFPISSPLSHRRQDQEQPPRAKKPKRHTEDCRAQRSRTLNAIELPHRPCPQASRERNGFPSCFSHCILVSWGPLVQRVAERPGRRLVNIMGYHRGQRNEVRELTWQWGP